MPRPAAKCIPPAYDWRAALGEVPPIAVPKSGQTGNAHLLRRAMQHGGAFEKRAYKVIEKALRLAEGRIPVLAVMLECHYLTAWRLVGAAELEDLAGQLRYEHGHPGPTGFGIQTRAQQKAHKRARLKLLKLMKL